jgi:hypothetical protein
MIVIWHIPMRIEAFLRDNTPSWLYWTVEPMTLLVTLVLTAVLLFHGVKQLRGPEPPSSLDDIEAWFRTHLSDLPSDYRIIAINVTDYLNSPAAARIRIDDGCRFIVVLYYDLLSKKMLDCRAYPRGGSP